MKHTLLIIGNSLVAYIIGVYTAPFWSLVPSTF